MLGVMIVVALVAVLATYVYLGHEQMGLEGVGLATLRTAGLGALVLLLLNPGRTVRVAGEAPTVLLDASLSMDAAGGRWESARDTAKALAGAAGMVRRFGSRVAAFDTVPPTDGASRLTAALTAARAAARPVVVVTDGEIDDLGSMPDQLLAGVRFIVLPRDTLVNAALVAATAPQRAQREDSLEVQVAVSVWGVAAAADARIEVFEGERRLATDDITVPPAPSVARRRIVLRPGVLSMGTHVLRVRVSLVGDVEPRDDERLLVLEVSEQPAVVIIVDPADWEGRFLATELRDIVQSAVRGYARVAPDRWLDMSTASPVEAATVAGAARRAGLVLVSGGQSVSAAYAGASQAVWRWPGGKDAGTEFFTGDWYLGGPAPASPLAGALGRIEWDSLPPLSGVVPLVAGPNEWVGLTARQGRRGAERPILVGRDSGGTRTLTTAGAGLWRWRFRGGAAREAYRTLLAAGTDWLLGAEALRRRSALEAGTVVARGEPVAFHWTADSVPDSLVIAVTGEAAGESRATLRFDGDGIARYEAPPGVYRWSAVANPRLSGVVAVEDYSAEFAPRAVWTPSTAVADSRRTVERFARGQWWLFVVAVGALAGEWAWRYRRGLP